jgi:hypothetical protein
MLAGPVGGTAQNAGAERYKIPVQAAIQPKHHVGSDSVGNVVVTYADGTIDFWTLKGNCKLPKVSSQGAVGWVVCETEPNSSSLKLYDGVVIGSSLTVNFKGRIVANLRAAKPFIEDWAFETDGRRVIVKSRSAHGSAVIERFGLHDGPPEAAVEANREGLPDWAQAFGEGSSEGESTATESGRNADNNQEDNFENAVAQATRIIRTNIIPQYETRDGFNVKPMDINYGADPAIEKLEDEFGSIWKKLDPVVSDSYTEIQREANERTRPEANRYRALLSDAFSQAVGLRGGGSASGQLLTFAPAQVEWIIAHFGVTEGLPVSDEEFVSRLTRSLSVGASPERREVQSVLGKLQATERFLNLNDAAFLRAEFLSYFERGS